MTRVHFWRTDRVHKTKIKTNFPYQHKLLNITNDGGLNCASNGIQIHIGGTDSLKTEYSYFNISEISPRLKNPRQYHSHRCLCCIEWSRFFCLVISMPSKILTKENKLNFFSEKSNILFKTGNTLIFVNIFPINKYTNYLADFFILIIISKQLTHSMTIRFFTTLWETLLTLTSLVFIYGAGV